MHLQKRTRCTCGMHKNWKVGLVACNNGGCMDESQVLQERHDQEDGYSN